MICKIDIICAIESIELIVLYCQHFIIFKLLSAANFYNREGDLESVTRVLNQLTGEPRRIVADWLKEARLSLEVMQALDALSAVAQSQIISARSFS